MLSKKNIKSALGRTADRLGLLTRDFRSKMIIIAFHRVNDWMAEDAITCNSAKFESFCRFFQSHFKVVPLSAQIAGCRERRNMGGTLSITLDDGYRDNAEVAAPILRKLGLPATFFVTTGFIGTDYVPQWDQHLTRQPGWMDWEQVRALRDQSFDIGCHTETHIDLGAAEPDLIRKELTRCRAKVEDELGTSATLFAYPFGGRHNISAASLELVRGAGFECCVSCCGGVNAPVADPFGLNRISVSPWYMTPHQLGLELFAQLA
jgi:peptidoglycan/xylan/chitin deacetylase (PgdA/CDA1 family)